MKTFLDCHSPDSLSPARDTQCRSRVARRVRRGEMAAPDAREREMMSSEDSRSQDTSQRQVRAEVMISRRCGGLSMRVAGGERREVRMEHIRGVAAVGATSRAGATRVGDTRAETRRRRRRHGDGDAETETRRRGDGDAETRRRADGDGDAETENVAEAASASVGEGFPLPRELAPGGMGGLQAHARQRRDEGLVHSSYARVRDPPATSRRGTTWLAGRAEE
jgi:hypothetical protein